MKVSVIVTTYNRPGALIRVLDGLLAQTRLPDEIIVADDGSGEETRQALAPYVNRERPKTLHAWQPDKGFRAAMCRNLAVLSSSGEYLVLLDGDCIPGKNFIEDHLSLARPGCFFQGKRVLVNENAAPSFTIKDTGSVLHQMRLVLAGSLSNGHHIARLPFFPSYTVRGMSGIRSCNMGIFRKDVVAVNGFNHAFTGWGREDSEFVCRLYKWGLKRTENPFRAVCYHLWHKENSRQGLEKNDRLLEEIQDAGIYYCPDGLDSLALKTGKEVDWQ